MTINTAKEAVDEFVAMLDRHGQRFVFTRQELDGLHPAVIEKHGLVQINAPLKRVLAKTKAKMGYTDADEDALVAGDQALDDKAMADALHRALHFSVAHGNDFRFGAAQFMALEDDSNETV